MMRFRILLALTLLPTLASAQERIGTRLDWGTTQVLIMPDSSEGTFVEIIRTDQLFFEANGLRGGFHPDSIRVWLSFADAILGPPTPPRDTFDLRVTPVLVSMTGDSIRLLRRPEATGWSPRVAVLLDPANDHQGQLDVLVPPRQARHLLEGLRREADRSRVRDFLPDQVDRACEDSIEEREPPAILEEGRPYYPSRGTTGMVIGEFVVNAAGHPEPATFRVRLADHPRLIEAARRTLLGTRFRSARCGGAPVAARVLQGIRYLP